MRTRTINGKRRRWLVQHQNPSQIDLLLSMAEENDESCCIISHPLTVTERPPESGKFSGEPSETTTMLKLNDCDIELLMEMLAIKVVALGEDRWFDLVIMLVSEFHLDATDAEESLAPGDTKKPNEVALTDINMPPVLGELSNEDGVSTKLTPSCENERESDATLLSIVAMK